MFNSILNDIESNLSVLNVSICLVTSIILGFIISYTHMKTCNSNMSFNVSLVLLPILVQVIIILVNDNVGTSIAVLGAFSLIRFRSVPGNSREIVSIFFAMAVGLAVGMGQVYFAIGVTLIVVILMFLFKKMYIYKNDLYKSLKLVVPEDLNYENAFDEVFDKFVINFELVSSKTINLGSLFELNYRVLFKNDISEKEFIDELRCRNGNLKIGISRCENENTL